MPLRVACQKPSVPAPFGLITPIPLTTTLRRSPFPLSSFILTVRSGNSLISISIALETPSVKTHLRRKHRHEACYHGRDGLYRFGPVRSIIGTRPLPYPFYSRAGAGCRLSRQKMADLEAGIFRELGAGH